MRTVLYTSVFVSLILHSIFSVKSAPQKDYFDEELLLKPLPSGHVYAYFQFTTIWEVESEATSCKLK
jgi:phosphatidylinositol glycan class T